jgi:hypothetical protein
VLISLPLFPSNSKYLISEIGGAKLVRLNYIHAMVGLWFVTLYDLVGCSGRVLSMYCTVGSSNLTNFLPQAVSAHSFRNFQML